MMFLKHGEKRPALCPRRGHAVYTVQFVSLNYVFDRSKVDRRDPRGFVLDFSRFAWFQHDRRI